MTATPHAAPVDERTASLLALVDGDPIHSADRARVIAAMLQVIANHGHLDPNWGHVDPNALRAALTDEHGNSTVYPNVIGAVVQSLARRGVLIPNGWVVTAGSRSGNSGKPARCYAANLALLIAP